MKSDWNAARRILILLAIATTTSGCSGGAETESITELRPGASNQAPSISGNPGTSVAMGEEYSFQPVATDPDGDVLTFSVSNLPPWAVFDTATGELSGIPASVDVGTHASISISVSDGDLSDTLRSFSITVSEGNNGNSAPTISGSPATTVLVGESYSFTPTASDSDGDRLTFTIENMPDWATFDDSDGALTGIPESGQEGTYSGIIISVSDGNSSASLPVFSVEVAQSADGSVTLSWTAPTENEDGSTLTDLAGYKIYYGTAPSDYTQSLRIENPGLTSYVVQNLTPSTYYFVATAVNSQGIESVESNETVKVVN